MVKRYKTILSVLLVVLIVCAVVTVTGVVDINKLVTSKEQPTNLAGETHTATYEDDFNQYTSAGLPLLKTDVENIFYTMDTKGNVSFFEVTGKNILKIEDTGIFDISVSCSGQSIPVTIHYIEIEDKTLGYGLFTNTDHPEVYLYDYAFFKLTNQFDAYESKSDLLLLVDVEKDRFYDENKVYSESFYLYSSHETKNFLNEDQRIVDLHARLRTDYKMFTDAILGQSQDKILFFSSRSYNDYEYSDMVDIYMSGGYGENVDNNRYLTDIASLDFWRVDDSVYYFANKENAEGSEDAAPFFVLRKYDGTQAQDIKTFEGTLADDYLLSGDYLLNKKSGEIYNVITGEILNLDYKKFTSSFVPDLFKMSENGKYCIVRGQNNLGKPSLGFMDFEKNNFRTYTDNVFGFVASLQVLNDGTAIISLATGETASSYYQLVGPVTANGAESVNVG